MTDAKHQPSTLQALTRRVAHLESLLAAAGIRPKTLEQVCLDYFRHHAEGDAPAIVAYASTAYGLHFKPTSTSAVLCKLVRLKLIRKAERKPDTFHTYKGITHG